MRPARSSRTERGDREIEGIADGSRGSRQGRGRSAGARAPVLAPHRPNLDPIEQVFAKLKPLMRKARPRAFDQTWTTVGDSLDAFAPDECANYLENPGHVSV